MDGSTGGTGNTPSGPEDLQESPKDTTDGYLGTHARAGDANQHLVGTSTHLCA